MNRTAARRLWMSFAAAIAWWGFAESDILHAQYIPPVNNRTDIVLNTNNWKFILFRSVRFRTVPGPDWNVYLTRRSGGALWWDGLIWEASLNG